MSDAEALESRLVATTLVGEVVEALWALARAQLPRATTAVAEATQYLDWIDEAMTPLALSANASEGRTRVVIVLGPERPFAGSLPREVARSAAATLRSSDRVGWVGHRVAERAPDRSTAGRLFTIGGVCSVDEVDRVAEELAELVLRHAGESPVIVLYPRARRTGLHSATLLVGELAVRGVVSAPDTYSEPGVILARAVRMGVAARLRIALLEAFRAETHARVVATESARQAIDRKRTQLEQDLARIRQETITTEIAESFGSRASRRRRIGSLDA
jgi:F0F1-type ATP synthase gamma subunit